MLKFSTLKYTENSLNSANFNDLTTDSIDSSNKNDKSHRSNETMTASRRRQLMIKELFAFNRIADKGFPSKPSAMDYDRKLKLLAIGTKCGDIRIYGAPCTAQQQLSCYQDVHPFPIQRILFIQGSHQLITVSERIHRSDLTNKGESHLFLVLWHIPNINDSTEHHSSSPNLVEKIKEYQLEPKTTNGSRLSAITLLNDNSHLFLGFETGDVYVFNIPTFQIVPGVINKDFILRNLTEPSNSNLKKLTQLGAVESISHHPRILTKLLIAYQRGLWIIFDFIKNQIDQMNQTSQPIESASFYQHGDCVVTSHSDGSFILWDLDLSNNNKSKNSSCSAPNIVYGPYPCKPVSKCLVKTCKNDQPFFVFSGGCPRINYSDKITITVMQGDNLHVCFDFTSKIIDYFTIDKPSIDRHTNLTSTIDNQQQQQITYYDNPQALFVLLEEEFVAIDLCSDGWPQFRLPYLYSVHSSAIICTHYVNNVNLKFFDRLKSIGNQIQEQTEVYSTKDWPLSSSTTSLSSNDENEKRDILLTGHEDGSVRFWDVTRLSMTLIYHLKTNDYFQNDSINNHNDDTDENINNENGDADNWPPFRKVGTFDPYSDDPKLGIQKIYLCPNKEILVVAGTAGQVLVFNLFDKEREYSQINAHKINLIGCSPDIESHFVWKGHEPLITRNSNFKVTCGYQLECLIQLYPPATVSALALSTDWQLVSMGTSHGFALFDYLSFKTILIKCTLDPLVLLQQQTNPNDSSNYNHNTGNTLSRRKSLKKSLRESFRKLRRGRSQKQATNKNRQTIINVTNQMRIEHIDDELNGEHKPVERQVESREFKSADDIPPSVIRYMYFVRTFITNSHQLTNSLWVGTNTGIIYIYALQFLSQQQSNQLVGLKHQPQQPHMNSIKRANQTINCVLAKEMRLKHRAPVVNIQVIDHNLQPLPLNSENESELISNNNPNQENHKVIICSEEQFKVFQLPTLKPVCKFKLTAVEGARVRRIGYNTYYSKSDPNHKESCLSCLSNLGDISVYSLPQLKRHVQIQCMKQQDINAITSFVFSKQGQAFYLQSPSEFVHISMSARDSPDLLYASNAVKSSNGETTNNHSDSHSKLVPRHNLAGHQAEKPKPTTQSNQSKQNGLASPMSPPPPVPAPRTLLPKDDSKNSSKTKSPENENPKELNEEVAQLSLIDSNKSKSTPVASPTKSIVNNDLSNTGKIVDLPKEDTKETETQQESFQESVNDSNKITNHSKQQEKVNTSTTTSTSGISSQLSSVLDQSSISNATSKLASLSLNSTSNNNNITNNNINTSIITMTQSDSFNASSSGYNGSMSYVAGMSSFMGGNVDISLDSVVDKFSEEITGIAKNKIPPSIDENISIINQNDSLLSATTVELNGTCSQMNNNKDLKLNGSSHYPNDSIDGSKLKSKKENLNDDLINISPQKSSSPLSKTNQQMNNINGVRVNKIEQVTKRIENGSKLEYRETAID